MTLSGYPPIQDRLDMIRSNYSLTYWAAQFSVIHKVLHSGSMFQNLSWILSSSIMNSTFQPGHFDQFITTTKPLIKIPISGGVSILICRYLNNQLCIEWLREQGFMIAVTITQCIKCTFCIWSTYTNTIRHGMINCELLFASVSWHSTIEFVLLELITSR